MGFEHDIHLFQQIAVGDSIAFKSIFLNYRQELYTAARKLVKDPALAEEVVQETFIRLWIHRSSLHAVREPRKYLYRILLNYTTDLLRQENTRARIQFAAASLHKQRTTVTEDLLNFSETGRRIQQGIERLSPQQRMAYVLIEQQGLSFEEAARQMNISVNTVKSHLQKARDFLRNHLSDMALLSFLFTSWK